MKISFNVNGKNTSVDVPADTPLLWVLRDVLHLYGTKYGCGVGQCGSCTVHIRGRAAKACQVPVQNAVNGPIVTIEGLGTPDDLHPLQAAFVRHDGYQCGYCTPGQICSAVAVLDEIKAGVPSHVQADLNARPGATNMEMRERMSGNICRCGAYSNIADAMAEVAGA